MFAIQQVLPLYDNGWLLYQVIICEHCRVPVSKWSLLQLSSKFPVPLLQGFDTQHALITNSKSAQKPYPQKFSNSRILLFRLPIRTHAEHVSSY